MKTGVASLPLHYSKAPPWLFPRIVSLLRKITILMTVKLGTKALLSKLSDPHWLKALGCKHLWRSIGIQAASSRESTEPSRKASRVWRTNCGPLCCGREGPGLAERTRLMPLN
ncbi:MAG: DUF763 domain-containing protein, partial [Deltaproteobacteria bacterium]|nr:DUF763 domain-containing protein [Deltaproteobacteria bacterium]